MVLMVLILIQASLVKMHCKIQNKQKHFFSGIELIVVCILQIGVKIMRGSFFSGRSSFPQKV